MPIAILPRPSLLTSLVVAISVTTGLAVGVSVAGIAVAVHAIRGR